ncbi:WD repeat-containing protein 52 [Acromyrmex echinatior]|uniref:WD repeat-containing protein 52 n=1 Tax=Acromyrmex echinatior TaxID=103372 RepID=F4WNS5_ACREC|nr:WD repeat-containing protein 52 [Acromyrmex echinatior]
MGGGIGHVTIVSGCEWGNILLWEESLITLEICRKNQQPCHAKAITQFEYMNGELISVDIEEKEEPLPEIYIPKIPNKVLTAQYISQDIIWLSMAGFDAGYMYEYLSPEVTEDIGKEPIKSIPIYDADDIEIQSCLFYKKGKYLFLGMEHGEIRICKWKPKNYTDLSDYWILPMHDNYNGYISKMVLSHDQNMLFTCGYDGNLFSYEINDDTPFEQIKFEKTEGTLSLWKIIYNEKPDISINQTHDVLAIEEAKRTIGDYKLKTSSVFNLQSEERDTLFSKYKELLNCRKKLYYQQEAFNTSLKAVRTEKEHLHTEVLHLIKSLKKIHAEIPLKSVKPLPVIPALNINVEFPERKIMIEEYTLKADMKQGRTAVLPEPIISVCPDSPDEEYDVLLLDEKFPKSERIFSGLLESTTTETDSEEMDDDDEESELIYFDENVCPPECDKTLYDLAFSIRETRYAYEHQIRDAQRVIETLYKEIQIHTKKLKAVESVLKENEDDLQMFMLKKQQKLNNVQVTVLMKLHQLQYFGESQIPFKVHDCVVFDKKNLSKLYARIQQLYEETLELHVKHKDARAHLHRIKLDCNHMRVNNKKLQDEIKQIIMNKFGQSLSLNKLYETILRRIVYDIKANLSETMTYFNKRIKHIKENYVEELSIFNKLLREHTQKLSFLTLLMEEQSKLQKLLKKRIISNEEMLQLEEKYKSDITKLESILENQMRQKHLFQNDIKNLRLKTKPQYPVQFKEIVSCDEGNNRKISHSFDILVSSQSLVFNYLKTEICI